MTQPTQQQGSPQPGTGTAAVTQPPTAPSPADTDADNVPDNLEEEVTRSRKQPEEGSQPGGENTPTNASPENLQALERASQATAEGSGDEGEGAEGTRVVVATNDPSALRAELDAAAREGRPAQLDVAPPASTWGPGIERSYAPLAQTVAPPAPVPSPDDPDVGKGQLAFRMQSLRTQGWTRQVVTDHIATTNDPAELVRISEIEQERNGELREQVRTALAGRARELAAEARERQEGRQAERTEQGKGNVVVQRSGAGGESGGVTTQAAPAKK